jgi:hypothetical protein
VPARRLREKVLDRPCAIALADFYLVALMAPDEIEVLGECDKLRAFVGGSRDEPPGRLKVRRHARSRDHLQRRDLRRHGLGSRGPASRASTPSFATFGSLHAPVTA